MFFDEAISKPTPGWLTSNVRPNVLCHHVHEYRYALGVVDLVDGEHFFISAPLGINPKELKIPTNIEFILIPPYNPEMNPIELIWTELMLILFWTFGASDLKMADGRFKGAPKALGGIHDQCWSSCQRRGYQCC